MKRKEFIETMDRAIKEIEIGREWYSCCAISMKPWSGVRRNYATIMRNYCGEIIPDDIFYSCDGSEEGMKNYRISLLANYKEMVLTHGYYKKLSNDTRPWEPCHEEL